MSGRATLEAVVVGGGVAGLSAALTLVRAGVSTCVVERTDYSPWRPGETLSPVAFAELRRWLAPESLETEGFLVSYGLEATWGSEEPHHHSFLTNPYGPGWHVERRQLDSLLARHAQSQGVELWRNACVTHLEREGRGWRLQVSTPEGPRELHCSVLVDATGRSAQVARHCGVRRQTHDKLCSVSAVVDRPPSHEEHLLRVEATPSGWWYTAPLPQGRLIFTLLSDVDVLERHNALRPDGWSALLARTRHLTRGLGGLPAVQRLHVRPCETSRLERAAGEGWAAVGDAAAMWDPLSSSGIVKGLRTGQAAARALLASLAGDREALEGYAREREEEFSRYLEARHAHYAQERRWAGEEFWRRRHALAPSPHMALGARLDEAGMGDAAV
ncbi:NAD(P)/FAD-dependent oxidoreductase [Archangium lansingense]|uniref:NAD(P)/FAD-dependent oxidoreductase n=1 Tax=Archangium lansingense TaxID=2995310 RepID=A0ABT4A240_9BACT|nr:NAD(P)/FAD-dependent oxidoreductase [Archangium lansinium]MCY1075683.1 NAD(P)/FAD-dependent oxidoreductase [Archangium lansinium]